MDKSFVALETVFCPICGEAKETGNLILDKRMINRFDGPTCTRIDLCPEHQKMVDDKEWCAFLVCEIENDKHIRTGVGFMLKKEVADNMFNRDVAPINHCDMELLDTIQNMTKSND